MKAWLLLLCLLTPASAQGENAMVHASADFHFELDLPYDFAAPLFGAQAESKWASDWAPQFVHPVPAADVEGAVFRTIDSPAQSRLWVTTMFDLAAGRVQYVNVLNTSMVTRIDIRLSRIGPEKTSVLVTYERTALEPSANDEVRSLSQNDPAKASEWRQAIESYARTAR